MSESLAYDDDLSAQLHDLIQASLHGSADEADHARLERLILENPHARKLYVRYMEESVGLQMLALADEAGEAPDPVFPGLAAAGESEWPDPSLVSSRAATIIAAAASDSPSATRRRVQGRWVAAGLALATVVGGIALWISELPESAAVENGLRRVAQLQEASGVSWQCNGQPISTVRGQWLMNGRYHLQKGIVKISFPWGTEATFAGPAEFELQPNDYRKLVYGEMVAKVSPNDSGFTVDTPAVQVIDLGTEFGLLVAPDGDSEVHVFKGEVETRVNHGSPAPSGPHTLSAGQATRFSNGASNELSARPVAYNPNRFARAWQTASRVEATTGAVRFVHPPPASVVAGTNESSSEILIFLERQDVVLPSVTAVTLTQPGLYTTFSERSDWLPRGLKVDSYLMHFDPVGDERTRPTATAEGSVTFANPVIAVITRGDQLAAADKICASPTTNYFGPNVRAQGLYYSVAIRGLIGRWHPEIMPTEPAANDRIRLSPDRLTLTVQLAAGNETDQIRVLVASSRDEISVSWGDLSVSPPQPYLGRPFVVSEMIQAEHFDEGGDGVAYYDSTPTALSSCYRLDSSVEMLPFTNHGEPDYCVALFRQGEWIGYTVEIDQEDDYVVLARAASAWGGGVMHFEFGEQYATRPMIVPNTDPMITPGTREHLAFKWIKSEPLHLNPGRYFMRLVMDEPNSRGWIANLDCFRIERADADTPDEGAL